MANPLAKSIMNNIANKIKKEAVKEGNFKIDKHYEALLKDVMYKGAKAEEKASSYTMKWDDYLKTEVKEVNAKRMMTLEEFSCKRFGNK
ncbi:hypothetical protein FQB35_13045 [Crassaminicella thermophila]|uniref:Uncharacterized protein n=1 Tax=Crassaminicella thermophila TaxID=2599308 RepID=A0A5C0SIX1_CRATE|nr:hypothetical protein [Crassaminicella thermophila]QEK13168.1 hypothetical protein FQB35_13045 [Crassaminicella thermophila]